jgi:hypothetical protein
MPADALPAGPIFGPDFVAISLADGRGTSFEVPIFPDANNMELRAAGQAAVFYFQPARVFLANRRNSDALDFSMRAMVKRGGGASAPHVEFVGGSCTFTTTFALTDSMTTEILADLMAHHHVPPPNRIAALFNHESADPTPDLRMVPIFHNAVSCMVPQPRPASGPAFLTAQPSQIGSIEMHARTTFLVSCNPAAAEEIVSNLRNGSSPPFVVTNTLTEQFNTGGAVLTVDIRVDVEKLYGAFASALPQGDPRAIAAAIPTLAYDTGLNGGAVATHITDGSRTVDPALKAWIDMSNPVKSTAVAAAKEHLFDIGPQVPAPPGSGWWNELFGGSTVSLKPTRPATGTTISQTVTLSGAISTEQTVVGQFDTLAAAAKASIDTYLTVIDMGDFA